MSIHSRFAFLQFEREEDAQAAVKAEQRSDFRSAKIGNAVKSPFFPHSVFVIVYLFADVKMSMDGRQRDRRDDLRDRDREPIRNREPDRDRRRSRSPIDRRPRSPIERRDLNRRRDRDSRERDRDRDYRGNRLVLVRLKQTQVWRSEKTVVFSCSRGCSRYPVIFITQSFLCIEVTAIPIGICSTHWQSRDGNQGGFF